jgi:nucleoredoxin
VADAQCQRFTPMLAAWYTALKSQGVDLEIVFISSDKDEESFKHYFETMPWLAMPFSARELKDKLSRKLKVSGIPTLVVAGQDGEVYNRSGRDLVMSDPGGKGFPWKPPTLREALGTTFVRSDGTVVPIEALAGKYIALAFSAHWCPPCRAFTVPVLKPVYERARAAGKPWEVIFVSSDRDKASFDAYFGEQPWLAVPYDAEGRARKEALSQYFEVEGIPTLIMLDPELRVVNKALRGAVSKDPEASEFPWAPKPVQSLEEGVESINETPALIAVMDDEGAATQAVFAQVLGELAVNHLAAVKNGASEEALFLAATDKSQVLEQVRAICGLASRPAGVRTLCSGDMCMKLNNSTALVLLDIPNGCYYELKDELTHDNMAAFWHQYQKGGLADQRMQLGQ